MEASGQTRKDSRRQDRVELGFLEGVRRRIGDEPGLLKALGDLYTKVGRLEEGLVVDRKLARLCPGESLVWYNLGCSYALTQQPRKAIAALARAVKLGYRDAEWMRRDADLRSLHPEERFRALLREMQE